MVTELPDARIITGDALEHMGRSGMYHPATFTSLPDAAEMGWAMHDWREWFGIAARRTMGATDPNGYAIFYQTDRRHDGYLEDKAGLIADAASATGRRVIWHKIAVRHLSVDLFRPTYSHLICVSMKGRAGRATPDVFEQGPKAYKDATDSHAIGVGLGFLAREGYTSLFDPFCGGGSIPAAAAGLGWATTSIDILDEQTANTANLLAPLANITHTKEPF